MKIASAVLIIYLTLMGAISKTTEKDLHVVPTNQTKKKAYCALVVVDGDKVTKILDRVLLSPGRELPYPIVVPQQVTKDMDNKALQLLTSSDNSLTRALQKKSCLSLLPPHHRRVIPHVNSGSLAVPIIPTLPYYAQQQERDSMLYVGVANNTTRNLYCAVIALKNNLVNAVICPLKLEPKQEFPLSVDIPTKDLLQPNITHKLYVSTDNRLTKNLRVNNNVARLNIPHNAKKLPKRCTGSIMYHITGKGRLNIQSR